MRTARAVALVACVATLLAPGAALRARAVVANDDVFPLDVATARRIVTTTIDERFGHWDAGRRRSYAAELQRFDATVRATTDRGTVDGAFRRLIASLRNAHSNFYDARLFPRDGTAWPFELSAIGTTWVVSASTRPDIPSGTALTTIDGRPADDWFRTHVAIVSASSEREARTKLRATITEEHAFPRSDVRLGFANGNTIAFHPGFVSEKTTISSRAVAPGVQYLRIPSFEDAASERDAVDVVERWHDGAALIVDVRGNGGGSTPQLLLAALATIPLPWWRESSTAPKPARAPMPASMRFPSNPHAYRGRVVIIADDACASACEDFVMPLVTTGRARLVGARTFGSTGQPFVVTLSPEITVRIGSIHAAFPDGRPFEGVGIEPTDRAPTTPTDLRNGIDRQLATAVRVATR